MGPKSTLPREIAKSMIAIPAGEIVLRDEGTRTSWPVEVGAFHVAPQAVTRELYQAVRDAAPPGPAGLRTPVTEVSWREAVEFCNLLSRQTGLQPCYSIGDDPDAQDVVCDREADGLPPPVRGGVGVRLPSRHLGRALRGAGRDRLVPRQLRRRGARRRDQGAERLGSARHDRQRVGVVLGRLRPRRLRPVPGVPWRRLVSTRPEVAGPRAVARATRAFGWTTSGSGSPGLPDSGRRWTIRCAASVGCFDA